TSGTTPGGPPDEPVAFDPRLNRLFVFADSSVWTRGADDTGPWRQIELSSARPVVSVPVTYDPVRDQVLALFASGPGSDHVQAWALSLAPMSVSLLEAVRTPDAIALKWQSST